MHENDIHFLNCVKKERSSLRKHIDWLLTTPTPSAELVKLLRKQLDTSKELTRALGGVSGTLESLRLAAQGNEQAAKVKKLLLRELKNNDTNLAASRRVLHTWFEEWSKNDNRWQKAPIRFYAQKLEMSPCVLTSGEMSNYKNAPKDDIQCVFDATWLWGDFCVYAWHRWVEKPDAIIDFSEKINACEKAEVSVYKDKKPCFLFIAHGPGFTNYPQLAGEYKKSRVIAPWEITSALNEMTASQNAKKTNA